MITSIEIDGFKSLRNFKMEFRKGLNVLAGPNGSGKTNILQALEFIRLCHTHKIDLALEKMSTLGGVFSYYSSDKMISFEISGLVGSLDYKIRVKIGFFDGEIRMLRQEISLDGSIVRTIDHKKEVRKVEGVSLFDFNDESSTTELVVHVQGQENKFKNEVVRISDDNFVFSGFSEGPFFSYNTFYSIEEAICFHTIDSDINNLVFFDFRTESLRGESNSVLSPVIQKDGDRLARVLQSSKDTSLEQHNLVSRVRIPATREIIDYMSLLNLGVNEFDIRHISSSNAVVVFKLRHDSIDLEVPLNELSDGSLSWLGISVALLQHTQGWCFDEPDRHLHPDMIQKMMSLFRDHAEQGPGWLLMTTHNVAAIDLCDIEELQIVELNEEGHTRVRPVHNPENLEKVMYKYGRSLGSFYVSGSL